MDNTLSTELADVTADLAKAAARLASIARRLADYKPPAAPLTVSSPPPEYIDTRQAAKLLGITTRGLEGMRMRGIGPKYVRASAGPSVIAYPICRQVASAE